MIKINLCGGLGNQLFQIFNGISFSLRHNLDFKLPNSKSLNFGSRNRKTYWDSFFSNLKIFTIDDISCINKYNEPHFHYRELPIEIRNFEIVQINGFYQSFKYFEDKYDEILNLIGIPKLREQTRLKYISYFDKPTISVHFRLDDFFQLQDYHPIPRIEHYIKSLKYIIEQTNCTNYRILYFCQECDNEYVKERIREIVDKIPTLEFVKVTDEAEDWEQMLIMSHCEHHVIPNSSFSWWGSYINTKPNKIVCYPAIWFGEIAKADTRDLCPNRWVKVIS